MGFRSLPSLLALALAFTACWIAGLRAEDDGSVVVSWEGEEIDSPRGQWTREQDARELVFDAVARQTEPLIAVSLPMDFEPWPGDQLVLEGAALSRSGDTSTTVTLRFDGLGPESNDSFYERRVRDRLPPDGTVAAAFPCLEDPPSETSWPETAIPAGQFRSWLGSPRRLELQFRLHPEDAVAIRRLMLRRQPPLPDQAGTRRLVPLLDLGGRVFSFPHVPVLRADEIAESAAATREGDSIWYSVREFPEVHLANLLHPPLGPTPMPQPEVSFQPFGPARVAVFRPVREDDGILVRLPSRGGAKAIGIRFGYGPECSVVGVYDATGRLLCAENTFSPAEMVPGAYTEVRLPEASETDTIVLRPLRVPPGSVGRKMIIERLMVLE